jgi:hypothetical protein
MEEVILRWSDHRLKGIDTAMLWEPSVRFLVMDENL